MVLQGNEAGEEGARGAGWKCGGGSNWRVRAKSSVKSGTWMMRQTVWEPVRELETLNLLADEEVDPVEKSRQTLGMG